MKKEKLMYGVIGLMIGIAIGSTTMALAPDAGEQNEQLATSHMDMSMQDMNKELLTKSGDEFDKAFIEMMIAHHEGAIDMAEAIPGRAKHTEIKELGEAIIETQSREINDMYKWQADWGYAKDEVNGEMHGH